MAEQVPVQHRGAWRVARAFGARDDPPWRAGEGRLRALSLGRVGVTLQRSQPIMTKALSAGLRSLWFENRAPIREVTHTAMPAACPEAQAH